MKTVTKPLPQPPPLEPEDFASPPCAHSAKIQFICAALTGRLAGVDDATFGASDQSIVDDAFRIGELAFARYCEENLNTVRRFNKKLGI